MRSVDSIVLRRWDPARSKLAAAIIRGYDGVLPAPGERWLYLGAAAGTTASHVADLVGPSGVVVAVEPSPRSFVRLLGVARRYPNLWPVLGDGRRPEEYAGLCPPADGLYADVAQADQVEIVLRNADWFLREPGRLILALKTSSMGREASPEAHLKSALRALQPRFSLVEPVKLDPLHRRHFLVGSRPGTERRTSRASPERRFRPPRRVRRAARQR